MAEKRQQRTSRTRQYTSEQDILAVGASRKRRLRRIGNESERKPLPVITPRPRREQDEYQPSRAHREKRITKASAKVAGMPPVMARGGMESMAARKPRRGQPKRRFDISLGSLVADATGAEVRLPALPRLQISWRVLSGAIVLMMLASLFMIWQSPSFRISDVQAVGLQRLTVADLSTSLAVLGDSIFLVDSKELEQNLQVLFPELKDIDVQVSLPGTMTINATERQPVLAWTQDDTELWIDAEGVSFLPRGNPTSTLVRVKAQSAPPGSLLVQPEADSTSLPGLVLPLAPQLRLTPEMVSTILALNSVAPPDTLVVYSADHGLGWNDKQHGWKVFFGTETQDIDQKLLMYQALAAKLDAEGIQAALISVEYLHAPYIRMER